MKVKENYEIMVKCTECGFDQAICPADENPEIVVIETESIIDEQKIEAIFGGPVNKGMINDLTIKQLESIRDNKTKNLTGKEQQREMLIDYHKSQIPATREDYSTYIERRVDNYLKEANSVVTESARKNAMLGEGWLDANDHLPDELETVFISNGKGWTSIGCLVYDRDCGWHWAESNGVIYEEKGMIVAECESDDLEVKYWHKLPKPPLPTNS